MSVSEEMSVSEAKNEEMSVSEAKNEEMSDKISAAYMT
jgi:hypothetical protein